MLLYLSAFAYKYEPPRPVFPLDYALAIVHNFD